MAALLLLERLSPLERAVFVLRDVFGFGFPEIASAVGRSESACRQLAVRARRHMEGGRPRFETDRRERDELAARFFDALRDGDVDGLRDLLAADVRWSATEEARRHRSPGRDRCRQRGPSARLDLPGACQDRLESGATRGQRPARRDRSRPGRKVVVTLTLDVLGGRIQTIRVLANPDKLGHLGPVADAWAISREANQARRATD